MYINLYECFVTFFGTYVHDICIYKPNILFTYAQKNAYINYKITPHILHYLPINIFINLPVNSNQCANITDFNFDDFTDLITLAHLIILHSPSPPSPPTPPPPLDLAAPSRADPGVAGCEMCDADARGDAVDAAGAY